jgi:hypothetical protein
LGMPLGVIQFMPVYHPLHDSNNIHTEVCVFIQMAVYVMITWAGDRKAAATRHKNSGETKNSKGRPTTMFNVMIIKYNNCNCSSDVASFCENLILHDFCSAVKLCLFCLLYSDTQKPFNLT